MNQFWQKLWLSSTAAKWLMYQHGLIQRISHNTHQQAGQDWSDIKWSRFIWQLHHYASIPTNKQQHCSIERLQVIRKPMPDITFSLIRVLQASFLLGRWSRAPATGTPVAGGGGRPISGCRICCLGTYSSSLSYSTGLFAALTIRANKKTSACNYTCYILWSASCSKLN